MPPLHTIYFFFEGITEKVIGCLIVTDVEFIQHLQNIRKIKTNITEAFEQNRKMSVLTCPPDIIMH